MLAPEAKQQQVQGGFGRSDRPGRGDRRGRRRKL